MQAIPVLKDFFDKSLIPVGEKDKLTLGKSNHGEEGLYESVTHWLIALIWCETEAVTGWKVSVYPVCSDRPFWLLSPYYETSSLYAFEIALKLSGILETHSQKDLLTTRLFYREINEFTGSQVKISINYEHFKQRAFQNDDLA
ncbi:hypothetical protein [Lihuaxuella thermophila]|uniref:hypothetical protein n=1 Tax=Lihuaxuella thermophila TaxID=1173111 RepID=UPI0011144265|nr:hypothetical protein [Lihuaxuella thermophila]